LERDTAGKSGKLILHSGREVPYIAPSLSYGRYLAKGVEAAIDAGAEAIYLEEPEFWARAGWSDSFKHEWQSYYHVGKGYVLYESQSPTALSYLPDGGNRVYDLVQRAARSAHLSLKETNALVLRCGPCVVAAGLDKDLGVSQQAFATAATVTGDLINLFDADLSESSEVAIQPGTRALLLDVNYFKTSAPRILAASAKITAERASEGSLVFEAEGIDQTNAVVRTLSTKPWREITVNGQRLDSGQYRQSGRTLLLHFVNTATPQQIQVFF
jgi:hypothetical protein